ncbi:unnamed protein product [Closterium sp. NIES-53]
MYPITTTTNAIPEIRASARVISWLRSHLSSTLSNRFKLLASPDWSKFAIAGHSRGGAVCFALLRQLIVPSPVPLKAVVLLDPSNPPKPLRIWSPNSPQRPPFTLFSLPEQPPPGLSASGRPIPPNTPLPPHPFTLFSPQSNPPRPLRIWSPKPTTATALPVLLFQHGFSASLFPVASPLPHSLLSLYYLSPPPSSPHLLPIPPPLLPSPPDPVPAPEQPPQASPHLVPQALHSHRPASAALPTRLLRSDLLLLAASHAHSQARLHRRGASVRWSGAHLVLLFKHGFSAHASFLSQLLTRIAKHGYIVVAPQCTVLLVQHGFSAQTSFYSQLLTRIAKHGYIVVAPQVCRWVHISAQMGEHGFSAVDGCTVLLVQHGFSAQTSFYSQLLTRIAKNGYIVVAPQIR